MPKQTFFNLPEEKREQIVEIAIDEFAEHDYAKVSISRIVARAGIAKGSFYQYFEDKKDLYSYLLQRLVQLKSEFLSIDHPDPQHIGIFSYLRWMIQAGVEFELTYPKISRFGFRAVQGGSMIDEFMEGNRDLSRQFYARLVKIGKAQGDIDPVIDEDLAAFIFDTVIGNLGTYLLARVVTTEGVERQGERPFFERPEVVELFAGTINILESGMGARNPDGRGE